MTKGMRSLAIACLLAGAAVLISVTGVQAKNLAPPSECPGQRNAKAPEPKQERAMECLLDRARSTATSRHPALERAAGRKVRDVFKCGFSHNACGRPFDDWPKRVGYTARTSGWKLGENLAWGYDKRGSARQVFKAWLASPPHHEIIMRTDFEHFGIGLKRGTFAGNPRTAVWVLQMGCRGC